MNHALMFSSRIYPWERSSGAHRIATYLRQHGMDIEVVDFAAHWELDLLKEFTRKNVKPTTLFFGFGMFYSYWNQTMDSFSAWLKIEYPHIKTIAGGQNVLHSGANNIDIWVDSYGEEAMLALSTSLAGNSTSGIVFSPEYFGNKKVIKALHTYPSYNLGDYSIIMEKRDFLESWEWLTIEFSRGCKFSCAFCNFPILGVKEDTSRSAESFEREMRHNYDNFGIDRYFVADETFNDRVEKITKFANVVERLDFDPFFSGFIRADLLSQPDMIPELARMNFGGQYYGVETFNRKSGQVVGKGLDPDKVKQLILDTKNYFKSNNLTYRGTISLIVGLPFDTAEDWERNKIWLRDYWSSEGLVVFALVVEDLSDNNLQMHTNASKFSKNLQKYGLRSMGNNSVERQHPNNVYFNWREGGWSSAEVLWEHDTMNIIEAKKIADSMQDITIRDHTLDSWSLNWPEIHARTKLTDLNKVINISKAAGYPYPGIFESFVKSYSLKKINK